MHRLAVPSVSLEWIDKLVNYILLDSEEFRFQLIKKILFNSINGDEKFLEWHDKKISNLNSFSYALIALTPYSKIDYKITSNMSNALKSLERLLLRPCSSVRTVRLLLEAVLNISIQYPDRREQTGEFGRISLSLMNKINEMEEYSYEWLLCLQILTALKFTLSLPKITEIFKLLRAQTPNKSFCSKTLSWIEFCAFQNLKNASAGLLDDFKSVVNELWTNEHWIVKRHALRSIVLFAKHTCNPEVFQQIIPSDSAFEEAFVKYVSSDCTLVPDWKSQIPQTTFKFPQNQISPIQPTLNAFQSIEKDILDSSKDRQSFIKSELERLLSLFE